MGVPIVYMLVGLPGSGKSTWAKDHMATNPQCVVVSRDALRHMVRAGTYVFDPILEPAIRDAADAALCSFIKDGFNVILDETHVHAVRRADVLNLMKDKASVIAVVFPDLGDQTLERRVNGDARGYSRERWAEVIHNMRTTYEPPVQSEGFAEIIIL
jgi:predicted kinase